ncbi:conserved exported hypothetical protein [uncultured Desulfobacterium sp.]|uniref:DUF3124 domain-containing protein n=1 Tax=uncultured Desulfobacterium sp. TaxID=201089 RepID=A0A445MSK8_9BACT|nr:conserved exported hypothetical protein [uncultured Desulfobacterium sp.]
MKKTIFLAYLALLSAACFLSPHPLQAEGLADLSNGQAVYVPAYSHIYSGDRESPFLLTVTVSIRNIDLKNTIKVTAVDYYDTKGDLLKKFMNTPVTLRPLESMRYVIPEKDKSGGSGANFIVKWKSDKLVNPPIVETVMIGTQSQQGISFTSRGQAITKPE